MRNGRRVKGNFNPLPPHGGRRQHLDIPDAEDTFQSTPSAWRETGLIQQTVTFDDISIHSLRMEGDICNVPVSDLGGIISIHSLRMEGDNVSDRLTSSGKYFNPLPPHGGRLSQFCTESVVFVISIHSLRMEGDPTVLSCWYRLISFQSTPSAWRETILPPGHKK